MTMTVSTGMLKFQPLVEAVIVIVTSHRSEVKRYCSLILNSYLLMINYTVNYTTINVQSFQDLTIQSPKVCLSVDA